jgi:epoxide hydrolase-like predicted phosphatase
MIRAIIFDWGGVLCEDTAQGLLSYFSKALDVPPEALNTAYKSFAPAFQKGEISEEKLWQGMSAVLGIQRPVNPSLWKAALRTVYSPKQEMFALASHLKGRGYTVGLLSNAEMPAMHFFYEQGYAMFDAAVFSCAEGTRKPEQRIYEIALERLRAKPSEAVFIDDRTEFCRGAQERGINTILFKNPQQVRQELAALAIFFEQTHQEVPVNEKTLPFTCPICGRKTAYPVIELIEGAILTCPFCRLTLTLHGHMWADVQQEIKKLAKKP